MSTTTAFAATTSGLPRDDTQDVQVRTQVALMRALLDDIERSPRSPRVRALCEQLNEEAERLERILCARTS